MGAFHWEDLGINNCWSDVGQKENLLNCANSFPHLKSAALQRILQLEGEENWIWSRIFWRRQLNLWMSARLQIPPNIQAANAPIFYLSVTVQYCDIAMLQYFDVVILQYCKVHCTAHKRHS